MMPARRSHRSLELERQPRRARIRQTRQGSRSPQVAPLDRPLPIPSVLRRTRPHPAVSRRHRHHVRFRSLPQGAAIRRIRSDRVIRVVPQRQAEPAAIRSLQPPFPALRPTRLRHNRRARRRRFPAVRRTRLVPLPVNRQQPSLRLPCVYRFRDTPHSTTRPRQMPNQRPRVRRPTLPRIHSRNRPIPVRLMPVLKRSRLELRRG